MAEQDACKAEDMSERFGTIIRKDTYIAGSTAQESQA